MQSVDLDLASPVVIRLPTGGGRRSARTMDPRRVSLAIAQNFDAAASGATKLPAQASVSHAFLLSPSLYFQ